jgi:flagellar export protein FliJ
MAFDFSLSTLLRVRGIIEEREERLLQKILYEVSEAVRALSRMDIEIADANASRLSDRFRHSTGRQVHMSYADAKELVSNKVRLAEDLAKLEVLRDAQIRAYEVARQNREMLTDMREDKLVAYECDVARREQKTIDDNFIARRGRH